ncbi:hypothetical protein LCGC14_1677130, partial [marine sediment metagenome]
MKNYIKVDEGNLAIQNMRKYVDFEGKYVLDIGCGDGRISFQVARYAESIIAIDPEIEEINFARDDMESRNISNIKFKVGTLDEMNFHEDTFDVVLFSLSLCCIRNT